MDAAASVPWGQGLAALGRPSVASSFHPTHAVAPADQAGMQPWKLPHCVLTLKRMDSDCQGTEKVASSLEESFKKDTGHVHQQPTRSIHLPSLL